MFKKLLRVVGLVCISSPSYTAESGGGGAVSFKADVRPILARRCAVCHITGAEPGNISLVPQRAFEQIVGVPSVQSSLNRVEAGQPEKSYLLHKLAGTHIKVGGEGSQMPYLSAPLSEEQLEVIRIWIEEGAQNN